MHLHHFLALILTPIVLLTLDTVIYTSVKHAITQITVMLIVVSVMTLPVQHHNRWYIHILLVIVSVIVHLKYGTLSVIRMHSVLLMTLVALMTVVRSGLLPIVLVILMLCLHPIHLTLRAMLCIAVEAMSVKMQSKICMGMIIMLKVTCHRHVMMLSVRTLQLQVSTQLPLILCQPLYRLLFLLLELPLTVIKKLCKKPLQTLLECQLQTLRILALL
mmetsp:Transcript_32974/g.38702  ORF Transcript_32974/g.38702 Transcript_32974/m.38702 type:complete len:217 (-) Transcript_32974:814-1464(-)